MNFKKLAAAAVASVMAMGTMAVAASAYSAGLIYQTTVWSFRNTIAQSEGIWWDEFNEATSYDTWIVNDATITGDGTYTVSFEKNIEEECKDGPETAWNFLKLQTDIPSADYPDLQITIDSLKIDGVEIAAAKNAVQGTDKTDGTDQYADGYHGITTPVVDAYLVGFFNTWNADETVINASDFGGKVELTFTITGMGSSDNGDASGDEGTAGDGTANDNNTVGSTSKPTDDKQNADTGIEGVAVVAGIAVLAAGAIVVAKKRK